MRKNVVSYADLYSKYPNDPYIHGRFCELLRQYNKSRKYKKENLEKTF